jgi:hypothetical protein
MNPNDEKILALKKKIAEKKEELGKSIRFVPKTNCALILYGQMYNLHTLTVNQLGLLLVQLDLLSERAEDLSFTLFIEAYSIGDWLEDVKSKLQNLKHKEEETNLKKMETILSNLLSLETQTAIEIENIEKML